MQIVHYFPSHEEVKQFLPVAAAQGKAYTSLLWLSVFDNHYEFQANLLGNAVWFQSATPYSSIEDLTFGVHEWLCLTNYGQGKPAVPLFYSLTSNLGWSNSVREEALQLLEQCIQEDEEPWEAEEREEILGFFQGQNSYRALTAEEGIVFAQRYTLISAFPH